MSARRMGGVLGTRNAGIAPTIRQEARPRDLRDRLSAYAVVMVVVLLIVLGRLWILQVVGGEEYARQARSNHLKQREIPAPRGAIYDADGHRIAEVRASFDLVVSPRDVDPAPPMADRESQESHESGGGSADDESAQRSSLASELDGSLRALGGPSEEDAWALEERTDIVTLALRLASLLDDTSADEILARWDEVRAASRWRNAVLATDLSFEELERVLAQRPRLPGVCVVTRHRRSYTDSLLFAHLIGYQREVRPDELMRLRDKYRDTDLGEDWYESGDSMGKSGIEAAWEERLRGRDGAYWVQVDAFGRELGRSAPSDQPGSEYFHSIAHFLDQEVIPEVPGGELHLTVRRDLQALGMQLLGEESGTVGMIEVNTGRLLALVSAPAYDPEVFSGRLSPEVWKQMQQDPLRPMVDKALQGVYPPGSTWKMIIAAAVLGSKTWTTETSVVCNGYHQVGRRAFKCWNKRGHGRVDLHGALKGSCDVYFYRAGLAIGIDEVWRYAAMFGMGEPTGVGINAESGGLNPSTEWKRRRYGERGGPWTGGDTASAVIGQGYTLATPMQMLQLTATLANGGLVYQPQLVDRVVAADGTTVWRGEPRVRKRVDLAPEHFDSIRSGMFAVVEESGGTAHRQRLSTLAYAGKTGTAQVVRLGSSNKKQFRDHAWFVAFAPYENPEVAVVVLVENGEHGSSAAAPIARQMFELYFKDRIQAAVDTGGRVGVSGALAPPPGPAALSVALPVTGPVEAPR